jgi:hypothetical protein
MCRIILVDQRLELDAELDQFDVDAPECVVAAGHLVVPLRGRGYSIDCSPRFWLILFYGRVVRGVSRDG